MHILLISRTFNITRQSSGYRAYELAKYFFINGSRLDFLTADPDDERPLSELGRVTCSPYTLSKDCTFLRRMGRRLVYWPEPERALVRPWLAGLDPLLKNGAPDAVLVTSPPHSIQIAGCRIGQMLAIPYFADLRDDWISNNRLRWHSMLHMAVARRVERKIVLSASRVVLNTDIVHDRFAERYPWSAHKMITITNGYDECDYCATVMDVTSGILQRVPSGKRLLFYGGSSYLGFMTMQLGNLARCILEGRMSRGWHIVTSGEGEWPPAEYAAVWTHLGMLSPADFARVQQICNVLLLAMPPGENEPSGTVPLKAYGYLRSGTPIVYVGEAGATTDLLRKFTGTFALPRAEWPALYAFLVSNEDAFRKTSMSERRDIKSYSFEELAHTFLRVIREATNKE